MMGSLCNDISEFLDALKQMRIVDDKIVYALNTSIPTESFSHKQDARATCKDLFIQLVDIHGQRETSLQQCLKFTLTKVQGLKEERVSNPNDIRLQQELRREQSKLREIQTQVNVEEVIRGRTLKIYNERCRPFYKPAPNVGHGNM